MNITKLTLVALLLSIALSSAFAGAPEENVNSTTLSYPYPIEGMDTTALIKALSEIQTIIPDGDTDKIIGVTVRNSTSIEIRTGIQFGPKAGHGRKLIFQKKDDKWILIKELHWKS